MSRRRLVVAVVTVAGLLAVVGPATAYAIDKPPPPTAQIIGGSTSPYDNPWAVYLYGSTNTVCTGTLVSPHYVLTAAHCVDDVQNALVGTATPAQPRLKRTIVNRATRFDIGLVRLNEPVRRTGYLPLSTEDPQVGWYGTIYGYGAECRDCDNEYAVEVIKSARVQITYNTGVWDANQGPALMVEGVNGTAWKGDSGGPLFVGFGFIAGVMSAAGGENATVVSSVARNRSFIRAVIGLGGDPI